MSVELTTVAIGSLPVKQQKDQETDHKAISSLADTVPSAGNKLAVAKDASKLEGVERISKNETQDEDKVMSRPQLEKVAEQLHEFIGQMNRGLEFSVDKDSGRDVIKVLDKTSGELIKQYPTEEVLSLVAKLSEATGNFVDSKV